MFLKLRDRNYRAVVSTISNRPIVVVLRVAVWALLLASGVAAEAIAVGVTGLSPSSTVLKADSSRMLTAGSLSVATHFNRSNGMGFLPLPPAPLHTDFDYDGDLKADVSTWQPSDSTWHVSQSSMSPNGIFSVAFGQQGDIPVPADYDGDGRMNFTVWRPGGGTWYIRRPDGSFYGVHFGQQGDIPVPADYDGDGRTDAAVIRPSVNAWFILNSSDGQFVTHQFGLSSDIPVPADYDGDGQANLAVFRPSDHTWYVRRPDGSFFGIPFGMSGDMLVPADYDGDGDIDIGVYRPSDGNWFTLQTVPGCSGSRQPDCDPQPRDKVVVANLHRANPNLDSPVPADYDGDRKADFALWREGIWIIRHSSDGTTHERSLGIGATNDLPLPSVYVRQSP